MSKWTKNNNNGDNMRKYLEEYTKEIDDLIKTKKITKQNIDDHLIKISFFKHERLIHLLVTLFYGIFLFLSVIISLSNFIFTIVTLLITFILVFYVRHYFFLENHVQYLYKQYDQMKSLEKSNKN